MIILENIYLGKNKDEVLLKADCVINDNTKVLWFSTARENEQYIATSNADAFILFIFIYSVFNNLEFKSFVPISKRLKFGLLEVLLPAFKQMGFKAKKKQFSFEQEDDTTYPEAQAVGTAMSFGVDSFFTFIEGMKSTQKLNYLTLFNAGAFGQYGGKEAETLFENMKIKVEDFASQNKLDFLWADTNLNEIFKMPFVQTHTFRNFACVLVFQKLFTSYLYASSQPLNRFSLDSSATGYYELLISKSLKSNSLELHISGLIEDRIQKTRIVSENPITYNHINVCMITPDNKEISAKSEFPNCSKCSKCVRTMVTLDILDKLNNYNTMFDLDIYKKNRYRYLADLLYKKFRANDDFTKEIFKEAKERNYSIPLVVYIYSIKRAFQPILRKFKNA